MSELELTFVLPRPADRDETSPSRRARTATTATSLATSQNYRPAPQRTVWPVSSVAEV